MKKNKRVVITAPNDDSFEMKFNFLKKKLVKETEKYIENFCNKKGEPRNGNLSKKQVECIKKLKNRTEAEKLAIYETD